MSKKDGYAIAHEQILQMLGCEQRGDILALIEYKHDHEKTYERNWEYLSYDGNETMIWENDWCEGQTDVRVIKCGFVSDIEDVIFEGD